MYVVMQVYALREFVAKRKHRNVSNSCHLNSRKKEKKKNWGRKGRSEGLQGESRKGLAQAELQTFSQREILPKYFTQEDSEAGWCCPVQVAQ